MNPQRDGHVYFLAMRKGADPLHDFELVKIGITHGDPLRRLVSLQTGNPFELYCAASFETRWPREVEHFMHREHAAEMRNTEWVECSRDRLDILVAQAKQEARRIEELKSKEQDYAAHPSNGQSRRATPEEFQIYLDAHSVLKELVPAKLRLTTAQFRLKAITGSTCGIPGIVRVKYVPPTYYFSSRLAESRFPELAAQCREDRISGSGFLWRRRPMPSHFPAENSAAKAVELAAKTAVSEVVQANVELQGWTERTPEMERWHDDFLQATRTVHRLRAKLADLQAELTLRLGDYDALDEVCTFKRFSVSKINRIAFRLRFQEASEQCVRQRGSRLRKYVYPIRSYY